MALTDEQNFTLEIERYKWLQGMVTEQFKYVIAVTTFGLRTLLILNGGAIISLFTLLGHVDALQIRPILLWTGFVFFTISIAGLLLAIYLTWQSQGFTLNQIMKAGESLASSIKAQQPGAFQVDTQTAQLKARRSTAAVVFAGLCFITGCGASLAAVSIKAGQGGATCAAPPLPAHPEPHRPRDPVETASPKATFTHPPAPAP